MNQTDALYDVEKELNEAIRNYGPMASYHEGKSVIEEELEELWDEIKKKPALRDPAKLRAEAKQVAAMAIRFMVDLT